MSDYRNVLREIKTVDGLLDKVNSLAEADSSNPSEEAWVAPMDSWKTHKQYSVFAEIVNSAPYGTETPESQVSQLDDDRTVTSGLTTAAGTVTTNASSLSSAEGDDPSDDKQRRIVSLAQLQEAVLSRNGIPLETKTTSVITSSQALSTQRVMVNFRPPSMDNTYLKKEEMPACPEFKSVENEFFDRSLLVDVHNAEGYNFSAEFDEVYKGNSKKESALEDFLTICKRAFLTIDSTIDDVLSRRFATYLARVCLWERHIAAEVCSKALREAAPWLEGEVMNKAPYPEQKVFLEKGQTGKNSMAAWVRFCPRLAPTALKKSADPAVKRAERKAHIAMSLCYYRRFTLSLGVVEEFEAWAAENVEAPAAKLRAFRRMRFVHAALEKEKKKNKGKVRKEFRVPEDPNNPAPSLPGTSYPPRGDEWAVHLTCRQNHKEGVGSTGETLDLDLYDDEDEVDQTWSAQALQLQYDTVAHSFSSSSSSSSDGTSMSVGGLSRETLKRSISRMLTSDPTPCSELIGWGHDTECSLGIGSNQRLKGVSDGASTIAENTHRPRPLPLPSSLVLERIKMIACSPRHTIMLSCLGNMYLCGENSEGALGLGDLQNRNTATLLQWPVSPDLDSPPRIAKVAAGSGSIGSHSMCIDSEGRLYGWGVPQAVGMGSSQPVLVPTLIDTFPKQRGTRDGTAATDLAAEAGDEGDEDMYRNMGGEPCSPPVKDVACGGGFTVCVMQDGRVCSWGVWQHGRLGHGPTPEIKSARGYGTGKKLARYKLRPAYIRGLKGATAVSCGEAHTLCLFESGEVKAWGQNSCGQLGLGPNFLGYLRDALRPATVPPFLAGGKRTAARVCAGAYHSCVVDTRGHLWTFGARGSSCLGHNDAFLTGEWADRTNSVFSIATNNLQTMVPFELLPWVRTWSVPRKVQSLEGHAVAQICAGDQSICVVTEDGHLFICGTGAVSPPIVSASLERASKATAEAEAEAEDEGGGSLNEDIADDYNDDDNDDDDDDDDDNDPEKRLLRKRERELRKEARLKKARAERETELVADKAHLVKTFRRPSASWLGEISSRRAVVIASGGTRCFAVLDEENVASTLTAPLLRKTLRSQGGAPPRDADDTDDTSVDSYRKRDIDSDMGDTATLGSYFEQRGRADCMLLVSGKLILCHRAVLAARSNELRDMIAQEMPGDDYSINSAYYSQQPTQLLLPELHVDSARALLHFLYTDVLPKTCVGNVSMLRSLERVSRSLRIPRLQIICERLLDCLTLAEMARNDDLVATSEGKSSAEMSSVEMPPSTLARDLGTLVGDPEFADVRFIADGRAIPAHRFILESRCEYFRAMFRHLTAGHAGSSRDGSSAGVSAASHTGMVDVMVPDTFVAFLRLLIFIYTDTLPDGNDEALLEDLLSADRYDIVDMKSMCESMLVPSEENWLGLLKVAELVRSSKLLSQVQGFLRDNFTILNEKVEDDDEENSASGQTYLQYLREEYPVLVDTVFSERLRVFPSPPSQILVSKMEKNFKAAEAAKEAPPFPIWAVLIGGVVAFLYAHTSNVVALGPLVPIINTAFLLGVLFWGYRRLFSKGSSF